MSEVVELLREIKDKLDSIERKLDALLEDEITEEELEEIRRDVEAFERGELETITLEELKKELEIDDEV